MMVERIGMQPMKRRRKKDFTRQTQDLGEWFDQWVDNLAHEDTSITMGYGPDGPEATFWHPQYSYMVAHIFEGVTG